MDTQKRAAKNPNISFIYNILTNTDKVDIQRVIEIYYSSRQEMTDYNSELTPYIQDYIQKSHPNLDLDTNGRFIGIKASKIKIPGLNEIFIDTDEPNKSSQVLGYAGIKRLRQLILISAVLNNAINVNLTFLDKVIITQRFVKYLPAILSANEKYEKLTSFRDDIKPTDGSDEHTIPYLEILRELFIFRPWENEGDTAYNSLQASKELMVMQASRAFEAVEALYNNYSFLHIGGQTQFIRGLFEELGDKPAVTHLGGPSRFGQAKQHKFRAVRILDMMLAGESNTFEEIISDALVDLGLDKSSIHNICAYLLLCCLNIGGYTQGTRDISPAGMRKFRVYLERAHNIIMRDSETRILIHSFYNHLRDKFDNINIVDNEYYGPSSLKTARFDMFSRLLAADILGIFPFTQTRRMMSINVTKVIDDENNLKLHREYGKLFSSNLGNLGHGEQIQIRGIPGSGEWVEIRALNAWNLYNDSVFEALKLLGYKDDIKPVGEIFGGGMWKKAGRLYLESLQSLESLESGRETALKYLKAVSNLKQAICTNDSLFSLSYNLKELDQKTINKLRILGLPTENPLDYIYKPMIDIGISREDARRLMDIVNTHYLKDTIDMAGNKIKANSRTYNKTISTVEVNLALDLYNLNILGYFDGLRQGKDSTGDKVNLLELAELMGRVDRALIKTTLYKLLYASYDILPGPMVYGFENIAAIDAPSIQRAIVNTERTERTAGYKLAVTELEKMNLTQALVYGLLPDMLTDKLATSLAVKFTENTAQDDIIADGVKTYLKIIHTSDLEYLIGHRKQN